MNLAETKIVVAVLFGIIRFAFGILPIQVCAWLKPTSQSDKKRPPLQNHPIIHNGLILAQCFSGGVFFATCFLYMMPEVHHSIASLKNDGALSTHYPYSQLLISIGFFFIYFLEEFCHWLVSITPQTPFKCKIRKANAEIEKVAEVEELHQEKDEVSEKSSSDDETPSEELDDLLEEEVRTNQEVMRCALIALALSLHSIFEGVAVGLQHSVTHIWYIFTAISVHSATTLFYVGVLIFLRGKKAKTIITRMAFLAVSSPLGVFIGLLLSSTANTSVTAVILEGVSTGTVLYIIFIEILGKEKERRVCRRTRGFVIGAGFAIMAGLVCIT